MAISARFPAARTPESTTNTNIWLDWELFNRVRQIAMQEDRSFCNMVQVLLKRGLKVTNVPE
jgi:hypothetical protein